MRSIFSKLQNRVMHYDITNQATDSKFFLKNLLSW